MSSLKKINAAFVEDFSSGKSLEGFNSILDKQQKHLLEFYPWEKKNEDLPKVFFSIAHNSHSVLLKFFVEENEVRANVTKTNGAVWEDSCVEFFVSFDESGYYNFEFNCIGTVLTAFGKNRNERTFLPEEVLKKIETQTKLTKKSERFYWEMLIVIPVETFVHNSFQTLSGIICKSNFYKCGDNLSQPHYLSWSNILADKPDFHLPQFFGELTFV